MGTWAALKQELDLWTEAGLTATMWWRDDDATHASSELTRLLGIAQRTHVPVALAVIPRDINDSLHRCVEDLDELFVLQHGWSHANHAPGTQRQEEFGPHRPRDVMLAELSEGRRRIATFARGLPVLVAPWNRMDAGLLEDLPKAGLAAVSTLGPRADREPAAGVRQTNVHVDIVDWAGHRGFVGETGAIHQVLAHLHQRRQGEADALEPTGLMTHHLFHDEGCWWFVEEFIRRTKEHPAVCWVAAREAFWP